MLEALHAGQAAMLNGMKLVMHDGQNCIEAQAYRYRGGERTELPPRLLGFDPSLNHFIEACDKISDDEISIIGAQSAMTREARKRARAR